MPKRDIVATLQRGGALGTQRLLMERVHDNELCPKSFVALDAAGMTRNNVKNRQTVPIGIYSGKLVSTVDTSGKPVAFFCTLAIGNVTPPRKTKASSV